MQKRFYLRCALCSVILLLLFFTSAAQLSAHPLGNFTINHYARLEPDATQLRIRYVLDFAEIPTFQEKPLIDLNADGVISTQERDQYISARAAQLIKNLSLTMDGHPTTLTREANTGQLEFLQGQGGLEVLRLSMWLRAPLQINASGTTITFADSSFNDRLGWREIVARAGAGVALKSSTVSDQETSQELTQYPADMMTTPLNQRNATIVVIPTTNGATLSTNTSNPITTGALGAFDRTRDDFAKLIATNEALSPIALLVSFLAAITLGALHAFSPGHGKAVVGAYLVGSRGSWQHAVFLGLVVTTTHTAGVYALGFVTLFLSAYILPEQLFPWLGFLSGVLVAVIGVQLIIQRARAARGNLPEHVYEHAHADGTIHSHATNHLTNQPTNSHSHDFATPDQAVAHAREHLRDIEWMEKPSWRNLLSLGVSGGLLPCPSALVVMLSAIGLGRVWFGLFLIVGFSIGLAGVLVLTGLTLLYAGKYAGRFVRGERAGLFFRYVPIAGAFLVATLGVLIALDAFFQLGWVP